MVEVAGNGANLRGHRTWRLGSRSGPNSATSVPGDFSFIKRLVLQSAHHRPGKEGPTVFFKGESAGNGSRNSLGARFPWPSNRVTLLVAF